MNFRGTLVVLALVPAVSFGHLPRVVKRASPRSMQAWADNPSAPEPIAPNARLRVDVHLGPPDTVPITVSENGVDVSITRKTLVTATRDVVTVEIVPGRPLKAGATVIVSVGGVRSRTYRVDGGPDTLAPKFTAARIEAVTKDSRSAEPSASPHDDVLVTVEVTDESALQLRGFVLGADGGRTESVATAFVSNRKTTGTMLQFPAGALPASGPVRLRLEAVDAAGNVGSSEELQFVPGATADAAAPTPVVSAPPAAAVPSAAPAAPPERRGCL